MTDPGDLANTDANVQDDLPEARRGMNPGIGEEKQEERLQQNDLDQGRKASENPDPLDL